jgi:hypothetical protein
VKQIRHTAFKSSITYPLWAWNAGAQREKDRERSRQRAEDFINEIGASNVVSLIEHEPLFGYFSVSVWWLQELPEGETLVIRAPDDRNA